MAAILLHPEARSQTSATNGAMREPLIKAGCCWRPLKDFWNVRTVKSEQLKASLDMFYFYAAQVINIQ